MKLMIFLNAKQRHFIDLQLKESIQGTSFGYRMMFYLILMSALLGL